MRYWRLRLRLFLWKPWAWLRHPLLMWRTRKERALMRRQTEAMLQMCMDDDVQQLIEGLSKP